MATPFACLVWNIRGTSQKDSLNYLRNICVKNQIHLLALIEPMTSSEHLDFTRIRLGFDQSKLFLDRRVWIFWLENMQCLFEEMAGQLVHCRISLPSTMEIHFLVIYAKHTRTT